MKCTSAGPLCPASSPASMRNRKCSHSHSDNNRLDTAYKMKCCSHRGSKNTCPLDTPCNCHWKSHQSHCSTFLRRKTRTNFYPCCLLGSTSVLWGSFRNSYGRRLFLFWRIFLEHTSRTPPVRSTRQLHRSECPRDTHHTRFARWLHFPQRQNILLDKSYNFRDREIWYKNQACIGHRHFDCLTQWC